MRAPAVTPASRLWTGCRIGLRLLGLLGVGYGLVAPALLAWWLVAISLGPEPYAQVSGFFGSIAGRTLLFLFSWALIHHMLGGIRHLIWDTGRGLDLKSVDFLSWLTIILSLTATVAVWAIGLALRGGW